MNRIKKWVNISAHLLDTCMLTAISTQSSYKCSAGTFIQAFPIIEHEICVTYGADFSAFTHCTVTARAWGTFMCLFISKFSTKNQWSTAFSTYRCHTEAWKYAVQVIMGKRHHMNLKSSQVMASWGKFSWRENKLSVFSWLGWWKTSILGNINTTDTPDTLNGTFFILKWWEYTSLRGVIDGRPKKSTFYWVSRCLRLIYNANV